MENMAKTMALLDPLYLDESVETISLKTNFKAEGEESDDEEEAATRNQRMRMTTMINKGLRQRMKRKAMMIPQRKPN